MSHNHGDGDRMGECAIDPHDCYGECRWRVGVYLGFNCASGGGSSPGQNEDATRSAIDSQPLTSSTARSFQVNATLETVETRHSDCGGDLIVTDSATALTEGRLASNRQ